MQNCSKCKGSLEFTAGDMYARCQACGTLFMNVAGNWQEYPVDASMRPMIEQSLGFAPSAPAPAPVMSIPKDCPICQAAFERVEIEGTVLVRCPRCGALYDVRPLEGLTPIVVEAPGGGWHPEFQALFEEKLGFRKKVRRLPIGVPE
ncbi:MAG: hypothetical protein ACOYYJ_13115 [Chloroflexota bacterium]